MDLAPTTIIPGAPLGLASEHLLGWNLEWISDVPRDLTGERLDNPTFRVQADAQTGLAAPWKKFMEFGGNQAFAVEPGQGLDGGTAQRLHAWGANEAIIVQPGRRCRAGERLRVVLWARCQGAAVTLAVGLRGKGLPGPIHAQAEFRVAASHFARYEAVLVPARDDDQACFFITVATRPGLVYIDRVSLRPADIGAEDPAVLTAMSELAIPDLRWPGGCVASQYHWWRGVGPQERRHDDHDATFHWSTAYTWGTDEYLDLCRRLGARPHLTVNIGTGTPEEAAGWAAHCAAWWRARGLAPPPAVFQLGNEHYGAHEIGHTDPERYAACALAFAPGIRAAYPGAIIAATSFVDDAEAWLAALLRLAPEAVDLVDTHFYASRLDPDRHREGLALLGDAASYAALLDRLIALLDGAGSRLGLAVTEWGAFRDETHHDARFCSPQPASFGLFAAAMLNAYARRCRRVALAESYNLLNCMPAIVARDGRVVRTVTHAISAFWRPCFPARLRRLDIAGPGFVPPSSQADGSLGPCPVDDAATGAPGFQPWVDALGGDEMLLLTNRHPLAAAPVRLPAGWAGRTADLLVPDAAGSALLPSSAAVDAAGVLRLPACAHARLRAS